MAASATNNNYCCCQRQKYLRLGMTGKDMYNNNYRYY